MNPVIIACATLERELLAVLAKIHCTYPVIWLEAGMHNQPDTRRTQIQNALDQVQGYDTVLLAMTLCGGSVSGLRTGAFQLVIPRCQDCITLLLGSEDRRREIASTYFLTEGWLKGQQSILREYEYCLGKYGPARTERIFSGMLANYHSLAMVETEASQEPTTEETIRRMADLLKLDFLRIQGNLDYLQQLMTGPWEESRFLVIPYGSQVPRSP